MKLTQFMEKAFDHKIGINRMNYKIDILSHETFKRENIMFTYDKQEFYSVLRNL